MLNPRITTNALLIAALLLLSACGKDGASTGVDMSTVTDVAAVPTYTAERYLQEANEGGINKGHPVFDQFPAVTERTIVLFNGESVTIPDKETGASLFKSQWALHNFNSNEFKEIHAACLRERMRKRVNAPPSKSDFDFDTRHLDLPEPMSTLCSAAGSVAVAGVKPYKK